MTAITTAERLRAALAVLRDVAATYAGEARLDRWSDSSRGMLVTFDLHPDDTLAQHPFRGVGVTKPRYTLICVPIADDDMPAKVVEQAAKPEPAPTIDKSANARERYLAKDEMARAVTRAALLCKDIAFLDWISERLVMGERASDSVSAAGAMRAYLDIGSRWEIGIDPEKHARVCAMEQAFKLDVGRIPTDPRQVSSTKPYRRSIK